MKFRAYKLQAYQKLDGALLEDRLHSFVHSENILDRDKGKQTLIQEPDYLYGVLRLNEFDVEDKQIRRINKTFLGLFSNGLPKYEIDVLLSGEVQSLIAIHDFLVGSRDYVVVNAHDVKQANLTTETETRYAPKSFDDAMYHLRDYLNKNFKAIQFTFTVKSTTSRTWENVFYLKNSLTGPIEDILKLRKQFKTGFSGLQTLRDEISYS